MRLTIFCAIAAATGVVSGASSECYSASAPADTDFIACLFCNNAKFAHFAKTLNSTATSALCEAASHNVASDSRFIAQVLAEYGEVMAGVYWRNDTEAHQALAHLVQFMPRRDAALLLDGDDSFLHFLFEHVRYALLARGGFLRDIPDDVFLDYVLPYAFLNEKRDQEFRWRPRFSQLFSTLVANSSNTTEAMHRLASALPHASTQGVLELDGSLMPGNMIRWRSETSPMNLSPEQVAAHGGSCTGTAITMAAAARSVGIPVRIAGCSQSVPADDHHWLEYYDSTFPGPFNNSWHTKEGTSAGNAGGPWDTPSGPMNKCLAYLLPEDKFNTMWASCWSSPVYMPLQWTNSSLHRQWGFVGGINMCGAYCTAWGCGMNHTDRWPQHACEPAR